MDALNSNETKISLHHEQLYGRVFERRVSDKCCDIFVKHKKKAKGERTVSLEMARKLKETGINVLPGWKICKTCHETVQKCNQIGNQLEHDLFQDDMESLSSGEEQEELSVSRENLNRSFELAGVSPVKLHGLPKRSKVTVAKDKLARVEQHHVKETAKVMGVEAHEIKPRSSTSPNKEVKKKAAEFDKLMYKVHNSKRRDKIKLLTLVPDTWSRQKVSAFSMLPTMLSGPHVPQKKRRVY